MEFPALKVGDRGLEVCKWQKFLREQGMPLDSDSRALDGIFGPGTAGGTRAYQTSKASKGLSPSGIVDAETYAQAVKDGFDPTVDI